MYAAPEFVSKANHGGEGLTAQVLGSFQPSTHAAEAYRSQVSSQDRRPDSDQARVWLRQTLAELQLQNLSLLMHMSSRPQ